MINLEDGSRLTGDGAPMKKDLDAWLDQHPGYVIDKVDDELEEGEVVSSSFKKLGSLKADIASLCNYTKDTYGRDSFFFWGGGGGGQPLEPSKKVLLNVQDFTGQVGQKFVRKINPLISMF